MKTSDTRPSEAPKSAKPGRKAKLELVNGQGKSAHEPGPDGWPAGFYVSKTGLYYQEPAREDGDPDKAPQPVRLGPPIEILGEARNGQNECWGLMLRFKDPDGAEHDYLLDRGLLAGEPTGWLGELMRRGWKADGRKSSRSYLADCFTRSAPQGRIRTVARTGWTDDGQAFVLPSETIRGWDEDRHKEEGSGAVSEQYILFPRPAKDIFSQGGCFAEWSKTSGRWAVGNHLLFFAISAALAAPLVRLLGQESGGVHFYGETGSGKSTCLEAACSVWGRPDVFGLTWRATDNGLESQATLHTDCLLALDEIGQAPEKTIRNSSYLLGNEKGKSRARADGSGRASAQWRVMTVSTGELSFAEALKQAGESIRGGQAVRMIDLAADAGAGLGAFQCLHGFDRPAALSEAIKKTAKENHGWAGPEFVRQLLAMPNRDKDLMAIFERMRQSLTPDKAAPEVARAVKRFAMIATAGALASRWGFFDGLAQDDGESSMAVQHCLKAWLSSRGGAGSLAEVQALERLLDFISRHGARFQELNECGGLKDDRLVPNCAGFRTLIAGETEYYIFPDTFKNEICAGLSAVQAARTLADMGILKRGEDRHIVQYKTLPGLSRSRIYVAVLPNGDDQNEGKPRPI